MKRNQAEIMADIQSVYCALSPENLACDGEAPMWLQKRKYTQYNRELKKLFKEFGREVSEFEAYGLSK